MHVAMGCYWMRMVQWKNHVRQQVWTAHMHGQVLFNAICTRSTAASGGKSSSPSMPETAAGCQMQSRGADLIADSGYVHILLGIKGTIRHSANAFLHVSSNLIYMELLEASCGSAAVHFMRLCSTATYLNLFTCACAAAHQFWHAKVLLIAPLSLQDQSYPAVMPFTTTLAEKYVFVLQ